MDKKAVKEIQAIQDALEESEKKNPLKEKRQFSILDAIVNIALSPITVTLVVLSCPYGASLCTMMRKAEEIGYAITPDFERDVQNTRRVLKKLKKQGLVSPRRNRCKFFMLTKKGRKKWKTLKEYREASPPFKEYACEKSDFPVVVSFDIPEKMKGRRKWVREELLSFGLEGVQKSLYIGNVKIPKDFVKDMEKFGLISFIHIFGISQSGTYEEERYA